MTKSVKDAADILGIEFVDHVIVGCPKGGRAYFYSFKRDNVGSIEYKE